jgi:hypothetical protein
VFGIVAIQSVWVRILVGASLLPWVTDNAPSAPSVWLEVIGLLCLLARLTMGIVATSKRGQGIRAGRLPE